MHDQRGHVPGADHLPGEKEHGSHAPGHVGRCDDPRRTLGSNGNGHGGHANGHGHPADGHHGPAGRSGRPDGGASGRGPAPAPPVVLGLAEKRTALEQILQSATFVRGEQLRNFLRYICEMELSGRAGELSEYLVGVEALGRPAGYSTADDSSVRRRAHALRQKLEEVYNGELAGARVRIELPKGSYVPRFAAAPSDQPDPVALPAPGEGAAPRRLGRPATLWMAAAFAAGVLAATPFWARGRSAVSADPDLVAGWGPLAEPGANVLLCLSTPVHLGLLPYPEGPLPPHVSLIPLESDFVHWYRLRYPLLPEERLAAHRATGPVRLGEVMGLVTLTRTLDRMGVDYQIAAEKNVAFPALRGRNVLLVGNPEYSFAASKLLERAVWSITYDPSKRERIVQARSDGASPAAFVPVRDSNAFLSEVFGLITVLPSDGALGRRPARTVLISCTNSAGCQAAMEYFASPAEMRALRERFRLEQGTDSPPAYQVVVRTRVHTSQAISGEYEAHLVLTGAHPPGRASEAIAAVAAEPEVRASNPGRP